MEERWNMDIRTARQHGLHRVDSKGQTTLFRLQPGHYRSKVHIPTRLAKMASACAEKLLILQNILQDCIDLQTKLWGTLEELEKTNSFIHQTGFNI
ncbi:hypothetical protein ElyMa_007028200 [Elysia marginata]|uniref:Uncharacterized protein n=1 Tax=Elysia marginata TaxID=1093978 RepID=A0AAV4JRT9_9GAST|nr:hypothetical protein ElyMa_007028200 [Elysia marginata]